MVSKSQLESLSHYGTATIHEALGKRGNLPFEIKPLAAGMRVCGPAFTVKAKAFSNINLHRAYASAQPGDVIVADCSGAYEAGYWGDLLTAGAMKHGISGLVIDACIRDADAIEALGFPVFCRGIAIRGTGKDPEGSLNHAITIGGVIIQPGDVVVGDRDGVVIVPREKLQEVIENSRAREEKEADVRARLNNGETSLHIYGWEKKFKDRG